MLAMDEYIKAEGEVKIKDIDDRLEYEITNGKLGWIYWKGIEGNNKLIIYTIEAYTFEIVINENGGVEVITKPGVGTPPEEIEMPELQEGDIKFNADPSTMTNGNVVVTLRTEKPELEEYTLEYSKDGTTWSKYTNEITYEADGIIHGRLRKMTIISNVLTGNITNIDKEKPKVGTIIPKTNGATFGGTDNKGIIGYGYNESSTSEPSWTEVTKTEDLTDINIENLTADTTYYIWLKDEANNTENKAFTTGTMPTLDTDLETGNITFTYSPSTWTNGNVTASISTSITGFTVQYSKDGVAGWTNYTSGIEYTSNGTIYARLTDGTNVTNVATGNVTDIDKEIPVIGTNSSTTNSVTFTGADNNGIIGYSINTNSTAPTTWTTVTSTKTLTQTVNNLTQNETYYIWVKDVAGNVNTVKSIVTGAMPDLQVENITFTGTPNTWTTGSVTVVLSTNISGYTLQYSKNGTTWTNYTSGIVYADNGIIYGRLTDGINTTDVLTGNITNIDRLQPNTFTILPTSTTNSITCPVPTVTDAVATSTNGSSGIAKIEYKLNSGGTYSTSIRSWSGLTQGTTHTVYVKVSDNTGNTREITKAVTVGTVPENTITISPSITGYTNQNVVVTITTSASGYTLQYSLNGTSWTSISSGTTYTFTANGVIYARLYDGVNQSANATATISNIDKIVPYSPTITAPTSNTTQNSKNITISWNFTSPDSGDYQTAYQIIGSYDGWANHHYDTGWVASSAKSAAVTVPNDGNWVFAVRTRDRAGNECYGPTNYYGYTATVTVDTVAPTITSVTPTVGGVTFSATDTTSGIVRYGINQDGQVLPSWTNVSTTTSLSNVSVTGLTPGAYHLVWVADAAGNGANYEFTTRVEKKYIYGGTPTVGGGVSQISWPGDNGYPQGVFTNNGSELYINKEVIYNSVTEDWDDLYIATNSAIDVTNYTKLTVTFASYYLQSSQTVSGTTSPTYISFGLSPDRAPTLNLPAFYTLQSPGVTGTDVASGSGSFVVDISGCSGPMYFKAMTFTRYYMGQIARLYISSISLE